MIEPGLGLRWDESDLRVVRKILLVAARGVGKSTFAAALGLFGLVLMEEDEAIASVDLYAWTREQAGIIFEAACKLIHRSVPSRRLGGRRLADLVTILEHSKRIRDDATRALLKARTGEALREVGTNPSLQIVDELLTQKDSRLWEVMKTAAGKRPQTLTVALTTPSPVVESFAAREWRQAEKDRQGSVHRLDISAGPSHYGTGR